MTEPVSVTILTGFLGSGKTTLLNHLLHAQHGLKVAVVVNEFGSVGVDGASVAGGEQFVELDNGCLCCALNEELETLLHNLKERGGFTHLVLETTGMADPLPVAWAFSRPGLGEFYRVDAIVTVVDALNVRRGLDEADEARSQILRADLMVINKLDLVSDEGRAALASVREINDAAGVLYAKQGVVDWSLVLGASLRAEHAPAQEHGHHHHNDASFETWTYVPKGALNEVALEDMMYALPDNVYRLKGAVETGEFGWTLVNYVAGRFDIRPMPHGHKKPRASLVFIGPGLDVVELERLCEGVVAQDRD